MTRVRDAELADTPRLLDIYRWYVERTAVTFEWKTPTPEAFRQRMEETMRRWPYLVIESDGQTLGYAYAGNFHSRASYGWCSETTIYLAPEVRRQGLGRMLYTALEERLKDMGLLNLYACIGWPEQEDEYLTRDSATFHERMGYREIGRFRHCGYKFGRWYSMIWMEKIIGAHTAAPSPVRTAASLR
ncbi:MAG: N-acetyltransferase [Clostridia bacterium]|nr:N-acetyltransferase [Clostridia bacterium]